MKFSLALLLSALWTVVHAQRRNLKNEDWYSGSSGTGKTWTTTDECNCYEYLTDPIFFSNEYSFDELFSNGHHRGNNNRGYFHIAEFCCEFAAELVDPKCVKDDQSDAWINGDGQPPHAPVESLVCDIFDQEDVQYKSKLKREARNACYCFYRDIGCGREELETNGYCDYPHSEVTLDDFRMANSSAHNMCNACLETDDNWSNQNKFPVHYEGQSHSQCLGYCLLKRGDPNNVYAPTVTNERCCFDEHGAGVQLNGLEADKIEKEIIFMPFAEFEDRTYDYFFKATSFTPSFVPPRKYKVNMTYDGLCTMFMEVERYGEGEVDGDFRSTHPQAEYYTSDFNIQCEPELWDSFSVDVFDESSVGGIVFKNVTLDRVNLGDFGFAVQPSPLCSDKHILPDIVGVHGHNHSCISRPGGFGHMSGFELTGEVEISGQFTGDDIGIELIVGCKMKETTECCKDCCCDHKTPYTPIKNKALLSPKWL